MIAGLLVLNEIIGYTQGKKHQKLSNYSKKAYK